MIAISLFWMSTELNHNEFALVGNKKAKAGISIDNALSPKAFIV